MAIIEKRDKPMLEERIIAAGGPREFQRRADLDSFPWDEPEHKQAEWLAAHPVLVSFLRGVAEEEQAAAEAQAQQSGGGGGGAARRPAPQPAPREPRPLPGRPEYQRPPDHGAAGMSSDEIRRNLEIGRTQGPPSLDPYRRGNRPAPMGPPDMGAAMPRSEIQRNLQAGAQARPKSQLFLPQVFPLTMNPDEMEREAGLLSWKRPAKLSFLTERPGGPHPWVQPANYQPLGEPSPQFPYSGREYTPTPEEMELMRWMSRR